MSDFRSRRGSALLVVLGMLSFMIISAVAFSAWMRSSRLPNSFLRRTSASRQLVKAALAAAIDDIDVAIGNNPHPGIGRRLYSFREDGRVRGTGKSANRNHWAGRVFIGQSGDNTSDDVRNHLISPTKTVSTMNLEGLAYIPAPFVSEARYYARRSNAATWHDMAFDAGRYAFTAIDVSDCLDVNSLAANVGRGSSPYGRLSLAYLFENDQHRSYQADPDPKKWDDFMKSYFRAKSLAEAEVDSGEAEGKDLVASSKVPLTSVADLNLALYAEDPGGTSLLPSPFSKYVDQSAASFYGGITPLSADGRRIRGMAFVTDSWQPPSPRGTRTTGDQMGPEIDLSNVDNQPFLPSELKRGSTRTVMTFAERFSAGSANAGQRLYSRLSGIGMVLLKDYLDEDNVPTSLALPQVERTPMVCGIRHNFDGSKVKITKTQEPTNSEDDDGYPLLAAPVQTSGNKRTRRIQQIRRYRLDAANFVQGFEGGFQALVAYPFRRGMDVSDPDQFQIDAHVDIFLSSEQMSLRTGNRDDAFHAGNRGQDGEFAQFSFVNGVFRIPYNSQSVTFTNVKDEQSALKLVSFVNPSGAQQIAQRLNSDEATLFTVTYEVAQESYKNEETGTWGPWIKQGDWERTGATCGFTPINAAGTVEGTFANPGGVLDYLKNAHNKTATVRAAITLRIKNGDGKVVDMVPASLLDDKNYNNVNNLGAMEEMGNIICGRVGPMMLFSGASFALGDTEYDANPAEIPCNMEPKGVICADPRWNWAPEHWFRYDDVSVNNWLQACEVGKQGRDRDIFMMTSDCRYLQSVYELACLPRLTPLDNYGGDQLRGDMDSLAGVNRTEFPASFNDTMNKHLAWKTYNPYYRKDVSGAEQHPEHSDCRRDPFGDLNLVNRGGIKANPFTDLTNVVYAAVANTPTDWWAAGVDPEGDANVGVPKSDRKTAKTFNQRYAFNEMNNNAKLAWKDVERISSNIIRGIRTSDLQTENVDQGVEVIWQDAFDQNIDWSGDIVSGDYKDNFAGLIKNRGGNSNDPLDGETDDLSEVDRKFLYGYWRECFAARQQLFLVFVRAEPMMMGGGAVGRVPPALGARAVALVWRDPDPAPGHESDIRYPHRTRVLFYRQLD